jgi:hypothetical protein
MKQHSVSQLPESRQAAAMHATELASVRYPSVLVAGSNLLHICEMGGEWEIWLNTEDADFTGLCVAVGSTRQDAVTEAVRVLEAAVEELQKPPRE